MSLIGRWTRRLLGRPDPPRIFDWGRGHIDPDKELPFLREQIRSHWSAVPVRYSGPTVLDNYTHETQEMREAYRKALAEPTIKSALLGKIYAVMALKVKVLPASKEPFDKDVADFVKHCLTDCRGGTPELIWSILFPGLLDGYSVNEKVYREEERGKYQGKKTLLRLKAKDTRFIQFEIDAYKNIVRVFNMRGNAGVGFPPSDFVLFRYMSLFESPWGLSDLRAAFRAAEMIPNALLLRMIFLDKYTGPFIHAKVNDPAFVAEMKGELAKARQGGFIVTTPLDEIELLDLATRGTSEFTAAIEDLRKEVAIGISGAFLHMMTGNPGEERGSSTVQQDTVDLFIWALKTKVEECINEQLVQDLVDPNFGATTGLPRVELEAPNPEELVNQLKIYESLHILELPLSKREIYEISGVTPPDPNDPTDALLPPSANPPAISAVGKGLPGGNPLAKPVGKFGDSPGGTDMDIWDDPYEPPSEGTDEGQVVYSDINTPDGMDDNGPGREDGPTDAGSLFKSRGADRVFFAHRADVHSVIRRLSDADLHSAHQELSAANDDAIRRGTRRAGARPSWIRLMEGELQRRIRRKATKPAENPTSPPADSPLS